MTQVAERLKVELAALPAEDREELVQYLMGTLEDDGDAGEQTAFDAELARRAEDVKTGKAAGIPLQQSLAELREKYP